MCVSFAQADICLSFMHDQRNDGERVDAPPGVLAALDAFESDDEDKADAIMCGRLHIEAWLNDDRAACVATLGPGLGLEA